MVGSPRSLKSTIMDAALGYTKYCITCHQFYLSCPILIVKRPWSVTNTKYKSNFICHSLYRIFGHYRFTTLQLLSLTKWFLGQISVSMTTFHYIIVKTQITPSIVSIINMDFIKIQSSITTLVNLFIRRVVNIVIKMT